MTDDRKTRRSGNPAATPSCQCPTEVYSRVVGYYRPVQNWNKGKRQEFDDRVPFVVDDGRGPEEPRDSRGVSKGVCEKTPTGFRVRGRPNANMGKAQNEHV